jgi:hypothetical protein
VLGEATIPTDELEPFLSADASGLATDEPLRLLAVAVAQQADHALLYVIVVKLRVGEALMLGSIGELDPVRVALGAPARLELAVVARPAVAVGPEREDPLDHRRWALKQVHEQTRVLWAVRAGEPAHAGEQHIRLLGGARGGLYRRDVAGVALFEQDLEHACREVAVVRSPGRSGGVRAADVREELLCDELVRARLPRPRVRPGGEQRARVGGRLGRELPAVRKEVRERVGPGPLGQHLILQARDQEVPPTEPAQAREPGRPAILQLRGVGRSLDDARPDGVHEGVRGGGRELGADRQACGPQRRCFAGRKRPQQRAWGRGEP